MYPATHALSPFHEHVFHPNFVSASHGYDADFSVKDHVLVTKQSRVSLGSEAVLQFIIFVTVAFKQPCFR